MIGKFKRTKPSEQQPVDDGIDDQTSQHTDDASFAEWCGHVVSRWVERSDDTDEIIVHRETVLHDGLRWVPLGLGALMLGFAGLSLVGLEGQRADEVDWMAQEITEHQEEAIQAEQSFATAYRDRIERHFDLDAEQYDRDMETLADAVIAELDDVHAVQVVDGEVTGAQVLDVSDRGHRQYAIVFATQHSDIEVANTDTALSIEHQPYHLGAEIFEDFGVRAAHFHQDVDDYVGVFATIQAQDTVDDVSIVALDDDILQVGPADDQDDEISEESSS